MSDWQRTIDITREFQQAKAKEITYVDLAKVIVSKLKSLPSFSEEFIDENKEQLIEELEGYVLEESNDVDDLDGILTELYDWGDISLDGKFGGKKVCWIAT